jgi:hypothetical protein
MTDNAIRQDFSKPKHSNHKGDRKKPYDNGQKQIQFSVTSKSTDKDEPMRMHQNKEEALKGVLSSLPEKCRKKKA